MTKTVLIVDDEPNMLITLSDILNLEGFDVSVADDGSQAIEIIGSRQFDIILLDYKMPDLNGVETFQEIQRLQADVKVIFITAYYHESTVKDAIQEGAVGVCQKPLSIPALLKLIKTVI